MNYLAIDTSTNICSASLFQNGKYTTLKKKGAKNHSEYLPIFVEKLLKNIVKLDFIALNIGPGSFTGLKIGSSFTKGLAKALNIPIIPVNNFEALKIGIDVDVYYLAIYSHRDFAFYTMIKNGKLSDLKCNKIENFKTNKVFGYGFPKDLKVNYNEVIPCSEKIGIIGRKEYDKFKNKSINEINPIYLIQKSN